MFIPAEKSYDELAPDQKAKFRAQFSNLAATDEPSYQIAGLALLVTVHVDDQGEAKSAAVYETPDPRVARVVAVVLMKTTYKPARCNGKPCSSEFPFTARFDVE